MKLYKDFNIEAAHFLKSAPSGHQNGRMHGHSFRVRLTIEGKRDPETGLVMHFGLISKVADGLRKKLDHCVLNEVAGIESGTIEDMTRFIWDNTKPQLPLLCEVQVSRDSLGEGCIYNGPNNP